MELPPLRVGEAAEVALNAAAMQELTMKQGGGPGYTNLHRGKFVFNSLAKGSDGERKSKDMSCVHDCPGHGAPTAPRRQRVGQGRSPRQKREVYKGDPEAEPPRDEPSPSSRAEAVAAADELRRSLLKYDARKTRRADLELPLWDAAFQAVVRQVTVHCNERGQLLEAIRTRYNEIFGQLQSAHSREAAALRQSASDKASLAEAEATKKKAQRAMLFARGAAHALNSSLASNLGDTQRRKEELTARLQEDIETLSAQKKLALEKLASCKRRLEALQAQVDTPRTREQLADDAALLGADERLPLLASLLPGLAEPQRRALINGLVSPLGDDERTKLANELLPKALLRSLYKAAAYADGALGAAAEGGEGGLGGGEGGGGECGGEGGGGTPAEPEAGGGKEEGGEDGGGVEEEEEGAAVALELCRAELRARDVAMGGLREEVSSLRKELDYLKPALEIRQRDMMVDHLNRTISELKAAVAEGAAAFEASEAERAWLTKLLDGSARAKGKQEGDEEEGGKEEDDADGVLPSTPPGVAKMDRDPGRRLSAYDAARRASAARFAAGNWGSVANLRQPVAEVQGSPEPMA